MIRIVLLAALGIAIFVGAGYYRVESLHDTSFRQAEAQRDLCYTQRGYDPRNVGSIPMPDVTECTRSMVDYRTGENGRYLSAALFAAILVGAVALISRRRRPRPPPA